MYPRFGSSNFTRLISASAVVALTASFCAIPALAEGAADTIAGKFATDEGEAQTADDSEAKWLHEEARRAVERALALENDQKNAGSAGPASDVTPKGHEDAATAGVEPTAGEAVPETSQSEPDAPPSASLAEPVADPAKRDAEVKELSEKLRDLRRKRDADGVEALKAHPKGGGEGQDGQVLSELTTGTPGYISPLIEKTVSILIVMDIGKSGLRSWSKTADPMLCIHENCYLSRGPQKSAEKLTRRTAFGPSVALGKRGQACRSKPACIFRTIDLETVEAKLQPVDLRFLRHDRREAKAIRADTTCAIFNGELSCRAPVHGKGWTAWIVPESVAARVGASGLEAAMAKGLE